MMQYTPNNVCDFARLDDDEYMKNIGINTEIYLKKTLATQLICLKKKT